jgi:phosphoadenosine phosphosulfate reductase
MSDTPTHLLSAGGLTPAEILAQTPDTTHAQDLLHAAIHHHYPGRIALVSSFGTEAAILLHMVAEIKSDLPVLFVDTHKLFGETLRYRDKLVAQLGLTDVRSLTPDAADIAAEDKDGFLFNTNADRCCHIRKVLPLQKALEGFDSWISGRKGHHLGRGSLPLIENTGSHVKFNPLAAWSRDAVKAYYAAHTLPEHPLEQDGFLSVGCFTCTERVQAGEDVRAGRWKGQDKTECGIHFSFSPPAN